MTPMRNYERRRARGGRGLLPPNPRQWENEHNGLDLREDLGLGLDCALPTAGSFRLLPDVTVLPHGEVPGLAQIYIDHFRGGGSSAWSGIGIPLPDGGALVVYNDSHPTTRVRATMMEEFFHLRLGHPTSQVRVYVDRGAQRTYDSQVEGEAYGSGAAALVPYGFLRGAIQKGMDSSQIACMLGVSEDLVRYRAKVTKQYSKLR